jgi:hypothetical protein
MLSYTAPSGVRVTTCRSNDWLVNEPLVDRWHVVHYPWSLHLWTSKIIRWAIRDAKLALSRRRTR